MFFFSFFSLSWWEWVTRTRMLEMKRRVTEVYSTSGKTCYISTTLSQIHSYMYFMHKQGCAQQLLIRCTLNGESAQLSAFWSGIGIRHNNDMRKRKWYPFSLFNMYSGISLVRTDTAIHFKWWKCIPFPFFYHYYAYSYTTPKTWKLRTFTI